MCVCVCVSFYYWDGWETCIASFGRLMILFFLKSMEIGSVVRCLLVWVLGCRRALLLEIPLWSNPSGVEVASASFSDETLECSPSYCILGSSRVSQISFCFLACCLGITVKQSRFKNQWSRPNVVTDIKWTLSSFQIREFLGLLKLELEEEEKWALSICKAVVNRKIWIHCWDQRVSPQGTLLVPGII